MLPDPEPPPPQAPAGGEKSALAFFGVLLALFPIALLAQSGHPVAGLAATQVFAFLVPALVATSGSNLEVVPYLRLRAPRPAVVALGAASGCAAFLFAGGVMTLTQRLLPQSWVKAYDIARLFEGPRWEQAALAALAALLAPLCEEVTFRGYVQTTLVLRRGPVIGVAGSALLFALLHLDPVRFPALVFLGAVFGWMTWRSGSVWPSIAAHAANNGLAAVLLLAVGAPETSVQPEATAVPALLLGGGALALLLLAFRAASPRARPAPADALVRRDPSSPSIRFDPARVSRPIAGAALAGAATLAGLALASLLSGPARPR